MAPWAGILAIQDRIPDSPEMEVITLTGNLLAEWTFDLDELSPGRTHRAREMTFQVGGKGINVARILKRLGSETLAVGFAGGPMSQLCTDWLESHTIPHKFFPLEAGVRPGIVVRPAPDEDSETTFLGQDLAVSPPSWKAACQYIEHERPEWLAICGSLPGWSSTWARNIARIGEAGVRIAVDTYGPPLADLVKLPVDLVKINRSELERVFPDTGGQPLMKAIEQVRKSSPVHNWIVTDGPNAIAAHFATGRSCEVTPARISERSPTGSGDTFLAAILNQWPGESDPSPALAYASACASANAASHGIGDFPIPVPERFYP